MRLIDGDELKTAFPPGEMVRTECVRATIDNMPTIKTEIVRCRNCRWWDKENEYSGYCHAIKHSHYSRHWEISIHRKYEPDFYCADAERREDAAD